MKDPNWIKCTLWGDSKDIIKRIPDNSIDFILTDPPYNLSKHSTGNIPLPGRSAMNNDVADWDLEDFNPEDWADEFIRILKPEGNLFIFTSYNQLGRWHKCLDHRFDTSNFMIWHKTNPAPKIFKAGFLNSCEMIFTCWNKKHTWNFISQAEMHNFIESPICMRPERLQNPKHPAQKPVKILKKMIEIASNPGDIVFDPFMGTGSTGDAALNLGRRFIGIEKREEYFIAAKTRINNVMANIYKSRHGEIHEPEASYLSDLMDLNTFFMQTAPDVTAPPPVKSEATNLSPVIKWPGGKEKELKYIIPDAPEFKRLIDPFVGGGSVFMGMSAERYVINDLSDELISLYRYISTADNEFFNYARAIDRTWRNADVFAAEHDEVVGIFLDYRAGNLSANDVKHRIKEFCNTRSLPISNLTDVALRALPSILNKEVEKNLSRKLLRMRELEIQKCELPLSDIHDNILTAIKSAVYMNFRMLYNSAAIAEFNPALHCALFFFIRNYAYSGMFRYSSTGDFNVPYGGIAYNSKSLEKKLAYYNSPEVRRHFAKSTIYNLDFEAFLREVNPGEEDFVFVDPPYDTDFSTYARNEFSKNDQMRLASYLIEECQAKWMVIIKYTDFIFELYNRPGINIKTFDKEYLVSFMNRNNRKATHLLITNY